MAKSKSANTARLKKMHNEAKRIVKAHPKTSYQSALKQAGKKMRTGKIGARKSSPKKKRPAAKKRAPAKHKRVGKKTTVRVRVGAIEPVTYAQKKSQFRKGAKEQLAWALLAVSSAKNKTAKKKAAKKAIAIKREINALS